MYKQVIAKRIVSNSVQGLLILLVLLFSLSPRSLMGAEPEKVYTFGVFPYFSNRELHRIFEPVAKELSQQLEQPVVIATEKSHKHFIHKLNNEYFDFVMVPPFWFPVATEQKRYLPVLKMREPFRALVMVADGSALKQLKDIEGKVVATPPAFTPVVQLAMIHLTQQQLFPGKDFTFRAYETVNDCLASAVSGVTAACVSPPFAPGYFASTHQQKLRVLSESEGIPGVALIAHQRIPLGDRVSFRRYFEQADKYPHGAHMLDAMQSGGFAPINRHEYAPVKALLGRARLIH